MVSLPRIVRSVAFFADVTNAGVVSYCFSSYSVVARVLFCVSFPSCFWDVLTLSLDLLVNFASVP